MSWTARRKPERTYYFIHCEHCKIYTYFKLDEYSYVCIFKCIFSYIFVPADDGGFEMGTYRNKICQTPNIDALGKRSLIFNNAYTSVSSCSPRYSKQLALRPQFLFVQIVHEPGNFVFWQKESISILWTSFHFEVAAHYLSNWAQVCNKETSKNTCNIMKEHVACN